MRCTHCGEAVRETRTLSGAPRLMVPAAIAYRNGDRDPFTCRASGGRTDHLAPAAR